MFAGFITALRNQGVPVSLTEYLTLIGAMQAGVAQLDVEDFYFLARASLVKDERLVDRFDRVFALYFRGLAAKAVKETAYHRDHAEQWTLRLGDGTDESHARMRAACEALWRFTGELFEPVEGLGVDPGPLESAWRTSVEEVLARAGLPVPEGPRTGAWRAGAGRQGLHTESFGRMLAEMQHLHRSHPGASW